MTEFATLSRRKRLSFHGWGYADEGLSPQEEARLHGLSGRQTELRPWMTRY
jgi:hypothetical protein